MSQIATSPISDRISFTEFKKAALDDYSMAVASREASLLGRREVLTGKAKFGIFGDGKELAQIAAARCFKPGDIRSGYYRDQTLMFATGMSNIQQFFAQLFADPSSEREPSSAGRQMNGHFATRWLDEHGEWKNLVDAPQSSSDISPTAGQMVRALGLAYASKMYRNTPELQTGFERFTNKGNEVVFCNIGDASTSEGVFWETVNWLFLFGMMAMVFPCLASTKLQNPLSPRRLPVCSGMRKKEASTFIRSRGGIMPIWFRLSKKELQGFGNCTYLLYSMFKK